MPKEEFRYLLFNQLEIVCDERRELLQTQESLTKEYEILKRRLWLLKELLRLEGMPIDMPDCSMEGVP